MALAASFCIFASGRARAALTPRAAHTATLLPTGDVLITGGSANEAGTVAFNTAELMKASKGGIFADTANNMSASRSSHTATMLSNGCVLVAGGWNGAAAVASADVYDPATNAFTAVGAMTTARYNHTATLLNTGKVLVCGGTTNGAGAVTNSCELFTPTGNTGLGNCGGGWSPAASLLQGRALHTATLLKDGRVWFAGGRDPSVATNNGWLPTTERYDPTGNFFASAHPLATARGLHTATMMGDGRVLISGGFNAKDLLANVGVLDTLEIYDPVSNSMSPAATLHSRRQNQSAVLTADGSVELFGGLGNITTSYQDIDTTWGPGVTILLSQNGYNNEAGLGKVTGPAVAFGEGTHITLSQAVVGKFHNAEVLFSSPTQKINSGVGYWPAGVVNDPATGLRANLAGFDSFCKASSDLTTCGDVDLNNVPFLNFDQGQFIFPALKGLGMTGGALNGGVLNWTPAGGISSGQQRAIDGSNSSITTSLVFTLDPELGGGVISSGTITLTGGSFSQSSSYTATLTDGHITIPANTPIATNGLVSINSVVIDGLAGTIVWAGGDATYVANMPMTVPIAGSPVSLNLTGTLKYIPSQVKVDGLHFSLGPSTTIVKSMLFGDPEFYDPRHNATSFAPPNGGVSVSTSNSRYGHTATLLPNNDELVTGGYGCSGPICATMTPINEGGFRADMGTTRQTDGFATSKGDALSTGRAYHSSTLLPDGTILVAGGTNGSNVLRSAEIYDPVTETVSPTNGAMNVVRDQHGTALLPDGRVLFAGGFTTNATSTGSTNASEIYYPDTKFFLQTSVMTSSRSNHTLTMLRDGNVLAVGGFGQGDVITDSAEIYFSTSATWMPVASLPAGSCSGGATGGRVLHTATLLKDGRVVVMGGINPSGVLNTVCAYDPATNAWTALDPMPTGTYSHSATLLFDGRVLVAGGNDGFGEFNASYYFDPTKGAGTQWTSVGALPLTEPRFGHSAVLLPNGNVLISGGTVASGAVTSKMEMFHLDFSTWVVVGTFDGAKKRTAHTMTLTPQGMLFAIGGADGAVGGTGGSSLYKTVDREYFTDSPDAFTPNAPPSVRQSSITATTASPFQAGSNFNATGTQFRGGTEASGGGSASANSSFSFPHLLLQQIDGSGGGSSQGNSGFVVDLTTQIYAATAPSNLLTLDTSLTVPLPATTAQLPVGWYNVRVGANDVYSDGVFVQAGPVKPAAAPAMLQPVVLGISSITYSWTGIAAPCDGYNVYSATTGVFITTIAYIGAVQTSFTQTNLMPNTTTSILVAGYTITGDGPLSASATTFTLATAPTNVFITSVTFNTLLLQWSSNGNTSGTVYEVSQSTDWPLPFSQSVSTPVPAFLGLTGNQVLISQLLPNTTYTYRLQAYNTVGSTSTFSVWATTATRSNVAGVVGKALTSSSIQWSWNDAGPVTYRVYNATNSAVIITTTATTFTETGLGVNTEHAIAVSAITGAGEGPLSATATTFTLANIPGLLNPALTSLTTSSMVLGWGANGNPNGTPYNAVIHEVQPSGTTSSTFSTTGYTIDTDALGISLNAGVEYDTYITAFNGDNIASPPLLISTFTLPARPVFLDPVFYLTTPTKIGVKWDQQRNSVLTVYEVTYSSSDPLFIVGLTTAVPFSAGFTGSSVTLTGLITSATYYIRVRAMNPLGQTSAYSFSTNTVTVNGGAPAGSLAGPLLENASSSLTGNLGDGRFVLLQSAPGAFPRDTRATISPYNVVPGSTLCPGGFNVAVTITDDPDVQPIHPIYLTADYDPLSIGSVPTSDITFERYVSPGVCVPLETDFFPTTLPRPTFRARLNHFSTYQLVQVPLASTTGSARVFPNPWRAGHDGYVTIDQIPPGARVRIMTMQGETLLDQKANNIGLLNWTGLNGGGRPAASGLYIVLVESGGSKKILKLAVIR